MKHQVFKRCSHGYHGFVLQNKMIFRNEIIIPCHILYYTILWMTLIVPVPVLLHSYSYILSWTSVHMYVEFCLRREHTGKISHYDNLKSKNLKRVCVKDIDLFQVALALLPVLDVNLDRPRWKRFSLGSRPRSKKPSKDHRNSVACIDDNENIH